MMSQCCGYQSQRLVRGGSERGEGEGGKEEERDEGRETGRQQMVLGHWCEGTSYKNHFWN